MELPEGTPPPPPRSVPSDLGADVTIQEPGPVGIVWQKHTANPRGTARDFAVVKTVKAGGSAAMAGVRPFQTLMGINGMTVAPLEYSAVIEKIRETRPLRLTFAPLERAWLRAEVLFATPGPLGLKLEPATGDPRADGVKLKKVLPSSAHANNVELSAGMDLVAMRVGLAQPIQLNNMPYGACVAQLKVIARPLTLFFDPGDSHVATQSTAVGGADSNTRQKANAVPTWSRTSEEAVREALKQYGREPRLAPRVCEAFSNARYAPGSWGHELAVMHQQNELESFMASVNDSASGGSGEALVNNTRLNAAPVATPVADATLPSNGAAVGEFEARAMAAVVAEENFKALTLLENHTEEVLSRLLHVAQTELGRIHQAAAAKHSANAEALALWQERAERAETAEAAAREAAALAVPDTRQKRLAPSPRNPDDSALQERCEALQLRVDFYESRLREKEQSHRAELQMRDVLLQATELELKRAHSGTHDANCRDPSSISDALSEQQPQSPNRQPEAPQDFHQMDTSTSEQTVQNMRAVVDDPDSTGAAPIWPSFFKVELERLSEDQRHREAQIRAEALAQVKEERAAVEAKHASYEDVVERAYAQVLNVFAMPTFEQAGSH